MVRMLRGRLGPSQFFSDEGYIFVNQDVRGCYMSEGQFVDMRPHLDKKENQQGYRRKHGHLRYVRVAHQKREKP